MGRHDSTQPDVEIHSAIYLRGRAYPLHDFSETLQKVSTSGNVHNCNEAIMLWLDEQMAARPNQKEFKYYYITEKRNEG